ncbi:hypothetical protein ACJBCE_36160 [Streptomyces sp. NBUL23]|uniref:hypothetical protein n=1 Tax=Streptomyces sp. NBUL23 TaxID=3381354 RepID=UPI003871C857
MGVYIALSFQTDSDPLDIALCSFVAVLEPGDPSWTAILNALRLGAADNATALSAAQSRGAVERLMAAGSGGPETGNIVIVNDAGYDATLLASVLRDLPV